MVHSSNLLRLITQYNNKPNGTTSGSVRGHQIHQISWPLCDEGQQQEVIYHIGQECHGFPSWRPHQRL